MVEYLVPESWAVHTKALVFVLPINRSEVLDALVVRATGLLVNRSSKYSGAMPWMHLNTFRKILKSILSDTGNQ